VSDAGADSAPWLKYQKQPGAAEGPWSRYQTAGTAKTVPAGPPDPADTRGKARVSTAPGGEFSTGGYDPNLSLVDRLWRGITGRDVSVPGRVSMGMADPAVGIGQAAAHAGGAEAEMMGAIGAAGTQEQAPPQMQSAVGDLDTGIQRREQRYQGARQSMQPGQQPGTDWARIGGNIASPVTLLPGGVMGKAAARAGTGLADRLMIPTAIGAGVGAAEPVTGPIRPEPLIPGGAMKLSGVADKRPSYGLEKLKQTGIGALGGLAGGVAGEGVGTVIQKAVGGVPLAEIQNDIVSAYRRAVRPTAAARGAEGVAQKNRQILDVVDAVNKNKAKLEYAGPVEGAPIATGRAPTNLDELSQAVEQTKPEIFKRYDAMAQAADATTTAAPNLHLPEFQRAGAVAAEAERAVAQAERKVLQATAQQQRAGNNVYMTSSANQARQQAQVELEKAHRALDRATAAKAAVKNKAYSVRVDMQPFGQRLESSALDREMQIFHQADANKLFQVAQDLNREKSMTLGETQAWIAKMNKEMRTYYKTGQGALGDALHAVVKDVRKALDDRIEAITEPGYQALKNQYGALKSVEREIARAVENEAKRLPGGLSGQIASLMAAGDLMHAITNPAFLFKAIGEKGGQLLLQRLRDPNRGIARMFAMREAVGTPTQQAVSAGARRLGAPSLGVPGAIAGQTDALQPSPQGQSFPWLPSPP
jgi:hypothetical protein